MDPGKKLSWSNRAHSNIDKMARYGQAERGLRFSFPKLPLVSLYLRTWKQLSSRLSSLPQAIGIVRATWLYSERSTIDHGSQGQMGVSNRPWRGISNTRKIQVQVGSWKKHHQKKCMSQMSGLQVTQCRPEEHPATRWTRDVLSLASSCHANTHIPMGRHEARGPLTPIEDMKATQSSFYILPEGNQQGTGQSIWETEWPKITI